MMVVLNGTIARAPQCCYKLTRGASVADRGRRQKWTGLGYCTQEDDAFDSVIETSLQCVRKCFMPLRYGDRSGDFSFRGNIGVINDFNSVFGMRADAFYVGAATRIFPSAIAPFKLAAIFR